MELAVRTDGGSAYLPILHRLTSWVLLQTGQVDEAESALRNALAAARKRGDAYETVLLLDALAALGRCRSDRRADVRPIVAEQRAIMRKLGIVRTPSFPVAAAS